MVLCILMNSLMFIRLKLQACLLPITVCYDGSKTLVEKLNACKLISEIIDVLNDMIGDWAVIYYRVEIYATKIYFKINSHDVCEIKKKILIGFISSLLPLLLIRKDEIFSGACQNLFYCSCSNKHLQAVLLMFIIFYFDFPSDLIIFSLCSFYKLHCPINTKYFESIFDCCSHNNLRTIFPLIKSVIWSTFIRRQ